mgnify:CR=1 FL=1
MHPIIINIIINSITILPNSPSSGKVLMLITTNTISIAIVSINMNTAVLMMDLVYHF